MCQLEISQKFVLNLQPVTIVAQFGIVKLYAFVTTKRVSWLKVVKRFFLCVKSVCLVSEKQCAF